MKIKSISIKGNKFFGDILLDFTSKDGEPADTIIIAGENGCGKTRLLELIYDIDDISTMKIKGDNGIKEFVIQFTEQEMEKLIIDRYKTESLTGQLRFTYTIEPIVKNISTCKKIVELEYKDEEGKNRFMSADYILNEKSLTKMLRSIYSTAQINFFAKDITSISTKDIDESIKDKVKSSDYLGTEIKQLFVDIQENDANELNNWVINNPNKIPAEEIKNRRIKRFKNAFSNIFEDLNYLKTQRKYGNREVLFKKGNDIINIDNLSSGEKQIVFRGAFLLRNKQSTKGNFVLIDEPEISLHPIWQNKILDYYRSLFIDESHKQTSQIFIATHSPFIIHNSNRYNDKVIILKRVGDKIIVDDSPKYPSIGNEEYIREAFNINDFDSGMPIVFVEGETDEKYLTTYVKEFENGSKPYIVQWIGRYDNKRNATNTGDTALNNFFNFAVANQNFMKNPVVLLYDSDTNKPESDMGNIHVRTIPFNKDYELFNKGIENLLVQPQDFDKSCCYSKKIIDYGCERESFNKTKLCNYICDAKPVKKEFLADLKKVIEIIDQALRLN